MAVVQVDIWDSQSGSSVKNIINWCFNIGRFIATVKGTNMNPGVPQCKNCWKWGHLTLSCHSHISRCAKCYGAHITEHHTEKAQCCIENKKLNCSATKEGELCPHAFKCMNCKGDHQADSYSCPYWRNHFNREWHGRKQQELFRKQSIVMQQSCQQFEVVFLFFSFSFSFLFLFLYFSYCLPINVLQLLSSYHSLPLRPAL